MNKAVMISIQPYYVFLIIAKKMGWDIPQEKRIEVRKDYPKDPAWNKTAYIYCSKNKKSFKRIPKEYQPLMEKFLGKVIGEFVCDRIEEIPCYIEAEIYDEYLEDDNFLNGCKLTYDELFNYLNGSDGYAWHISNLVIYDKPKELGEFYAYNAELHKRFENGENYCCYDGTNDSGEALTDCPANNIKNCYRCWEEWSGWCHKLTHPPMSWFYVEA